MLHPIKPMAFPSDFNECLFKRMKPAPSMHISRKMATLNLPDLYMIETKRYSLCYFIIDGLKEMLHTQDRESCRWLKMIQHDDHQLPFSEFHSPKPLVLNFHPEGRC